MSEQISKAILITALAFLVLASLASIRNTSLTMDELAHLPAGYSYLVKRDMRLNPEHPPLLKDLAGLPLLLIKGVEFPEKTRAWREKVNGQWDFGNRFLFKSGNPAEKMIFWGRTPIILVFALGGLLIWLFGKSIAGHKTAVLALLFYCLSPTLFAHGRLVTTDVGIAVAGLAATYFFLKFLKKPNKKNVLLAGVAFGLAQLAKFTAAFLLPYFGFLLLVRAFLKRRKGASWEALFRKYVGGFLLLLLVGGALIYLFYVPHVWDYPKQRQVRDMRFVLRSHPFQPLGPLLARAAKITPLRPLVQYLYGLSMVYQRGVGGNTTYFLGKVSGSGWKTYFPLLYLLKVPLSFHLLTGFSLLAASLEVKRGFWRRPLRRTLACLQGNFDQFALLVFILFYWAITVSGNLNIGVRHLLPIFPFTFLLVANGLSRGLRPPFRRTGWGLILLLFSFQAFSVFSPFPHFIPYYNELLGGPENGHRYAVDSNLDWGQDLRRLTAWTEEKGLDKIYLDYFGGADTKYYLGDKVRPFWCTKDRETIKKPAYLAVSATKLQGGRGIPVPGFEDSTDCYRWLNREEMVKRIGYSIFVYRIE